MEYTLEELKVKMMLVLSSYGVFDAIKKSRNNKLHDELLHWYTLELDKLNKTYLESVS